MEQEKIILKSAIKQRKTRKLPKAVRKEEWDKLLDVIKKKDKRTLVAFLLAYGSGLRISEVTRCRPEHFQSDGMIFIPESKYGVERKVPIPKGWRKEFFDFLPINRSIRSLQRKFVIYKNKAGLNSLYTFHSLRHGFRVRCIEAGMPLNQVQLALGHANISTTSIYVKASPQDLLKSYQEKF